MLAFEVLSPSSTADDSYTATNRALIACLVGAYALCCFLLSFTDSYRDGTGAVRYDFVTPSSRLRLIDGSGSPPPRDNRYRLGALSFAVFLGVAMVDCNAVACFYPVESPGAGDEAAARGGAHGGRRGGELPLRHVPVDVPRHRLPRRGGRMTTYVDYNCFESIASRTHGSIDRVAILKMGGGRRPPILYVCAVSVDGSGWASGSVRGSGRRRASQGGEQVCGEQRQARMGRRSRRRRERRGGGAAERKLRMVATAGRRSACMAARGEVEGKGERRPWRRGGPSWRRPPPLARSARRQSRDGLRLRRRPLVRLRLSHRELCLSRPAPGQAPPPCARAPPRPPPPRPHAAVLKLLPAGATGARLSAMACRRARRCPLLAEEEREREMEEERKSGMTCGSHHLKK